MFRYDFVSMLLLVVFLFMYNCSTSIQGNEKIKESNVVIIEEKRKNYTISLSQLYEKEVLMYSDSLNYWEIGGDLPAFLGIVDIDKKYINCWIGVNVKSFRADIISNVTNVEALDHILKSRKYSSTPSKGINKCPDKYNPDLHKSIEELVALRLSEL